MDWFPEGQADQAEVDQVIESMLEDMRSQGVDMSRPIPVEMQLCFRSDQETMRAGAELMLAGWPGVRAGGGGTATHMPTVVALYEMVPTVESLRASRQQLVDFAATRGGIVVADQEGGESAFSGNDWEQHTGQLSEAEQQQEDQMVLDQLFAFDIDLKRPATITSGIAFESAQAAREAAAELFLARWPEVHVVPGASFWVVEVVIKMVPTLEGLRDMRVGLSSFAAPRGGSFVGVSTSAEAPKQVQEES
jgi:hypothetical protein